jgi:hypothetical protein
MLTITDDEFFIKLKKNILWQVFHKTKGEYINFAKYKLTEKQSYMLGRICAELSLRHLGSPTYRNDGIRNIVDKIIEQEGQLINERRK